MAQYTLKYEPVTVAYELSAYIQRILDGDEIKPSIHRFCASKLNMRVDDLIAIAQTSPEIGDLLSTMVSHEEAYITDGVMEGSISTNAASMLLRQPVFSWRDKSAEPIVVRNEVSYDEETRAAILASNAPDEIIRLAQGRAL